MSMLDRSNLRNPNRSDVQVAESPRLAGNVVNALMTDRASGGAASKTTRDRMAIRKSFLEDRRSDPNGYERVIGTSDLLSINFLDRGRRAADAVCRIRVPGEGGGWMATGFIVGP